MMKARGRNGYFQLAQTDVTLTAGGLTTWVELYSKNQGLRAPIMLTGDTEEVLQWAKDLVNKLHRKQHQERERTARIMAAALEESWYMRDRG